VSIVTAMLLALAIARPANAQVLIGMLFGGKLASENFNIGFEIGANLPTVDGLEGASRTTGVLLGLFASWRFSEQLHLYTGLLPLSNKGADDADPIPLNDAQLDTLIAGGRMDRKLDYLDIPVILQFAQSRNAGGFRVGVGPQVNILLSAHDRYESTSALGTPVVTENDIEDSLERFDVGVAFDAEYRIKGIGLAIGVRYYHGLTKLSSDGPSMYNRVLSGSGRIALGSSRPKPPEAP
jgi:hypothetical protein